MSLLFCAWLCSSSPNEASNFKKVSAISGIIKRKRETRSFFFSVETQMIHTLVHIYINYARINLRRRPAGEFRAVPRERHDARSWKPLAGGFAEKRERARCHFWGETRFLLRVSVLIWRLRCSRCTKSNTPKRWFACGDTYPEWLSPKMH